MTQAMTVRDEIERRAINHLLDTANDMYGWLGDVQDLHPTVDRANECVLFDDARVIDVGQMVSETLDIAEEELPKVWGT